MADEKKQDAFREEVAAGRTGIVAEFLDFLRHNKKWWLLPILIFLLLLIVLASLSSTGGAPFIYTLF